MKIMSEILKRPLKNNRGFTLIELVSVIAILGILAAVAIPQYGFYRTRAFDSTSRSDIYSLYSSCRAFWLDNPDGSLCSLAQASLPSYGFANSDGVILTIQNETKSNFSATSQHAGGSNTYQIGPEGYATIQ